jgi:hypothetical protein
MKKIDNLSVVLSIIGVVTSLVSLSFIGFNEVIKLNFVLSFIVAVVASLTAENVFSFYTRHHSKRNNPKVFVSYHYANKDIAQKIAKELRKASSYVWIDEAEINVGDSIKEKIEDGLNKSDYFLILLSTEARNSNWVNSEITKAISLGKKILPVKIDNSEAPDMLKNIAYADLSDSFEKGIQKVKKTLIESTYITAMQPTK